MYMVLGEGSFKQTTTRRDISYPLDSDSPVRIMSVELIVCTCGRPASPPFIPCSLARAFQAHKQKQALGKRISVARVMSICNFNCILFALLQIMHTLSNQLLRQLSMYPFNTLQLLTHMLQTYRRWNAVKQ